MNAVDTNVFVYALDNAEPAKQAKAIALLDQLVQTRDQTVLPYQVVAELLSCLRKWCSLGRISAADVDAHIRSVMVMFPLALPTDGVIIGSLGLSVHYSLSHWDSMLVAACIEAGVTVLYSEDLQDGATYHGVRVVNPFA